MNFALSTICAGLAGENNDFLLRPILMSRQGGQGCALEASRFALGLVPGTNFLLHEEVNFWFHTLQRWETDKIGILWPDTVRNDKLLHVDVYEARLLEPLLQLGSRADVVAGFRECAMDFIIIPLKAGAL